MKKNKKTILFRKFNFNKEEYEVASKFFNVCESRMEVPDNEIIVGRYSVIPNYKELERDLNFKNTKLINSYYEHSYITDMSYVLDIEDFTPKTYFSPNDLPIKEQAYVLKGKINSRKEQWKTKMFAKNKKEAIALYLDLINEPYIGEQGVVFREYVPLEKISESINGMPFTNEWRFFFYKEQIIDYGYYWSSSDVLLKKEDIPKGGVDFAKKIAKVVSSKINFFVIDIALTESGNWIVIELNDGQMSGLSEININNFYLNLSKLIE